MSSLGLPALCGSVHAPTSSAHTCVCATASGTSGNHALICPRNKSRFIRHQIENDVIREFLRAAGISSTLELRGLIRRDGRRPDGATMTPWLRGRSLAWDFTCVNRLATFHITSGNREGPIVASEAEETKRETLLRDPRVLYVRTRRDRDIGRHRRLQQDVSQTWLERSKRKLMRRGHLPSSAKDSAWERGNAACVLEAISEDSAVQHGNAACVLEAISDDTN